jgi:hypothetical protein
MRARFDGNGYGVFPLLAAWYSVLSLAAGNLRVAGHVQQLGPALMLATIVGLLGWLLSGLVTRDVDRRTLLGIAFVVWFTGYGSLVRPLRDIGVSPRMAFVVTLALLAGLGMLVLRAGPAVRDVGRFMRATVLIVLIFPLYSFTSVHLRDRAAARAPAANIGAANGVALAEGPSIFLIVLDKYTGSRSLLKNYGFDNSGFEERLRAHGFVVPRAARSNYPHTWMSLASMLNWSFLDEIYGDIPLGSVEALNREIEDNRTWRFLRDRGYEFVFLPSTFHSTQSNSFADRQIPEPARRGANVAAAWMASSAAFVVPAGLGGRGRLPGMRFPYPVETPADFEMKFELLPRLAAEPGPRFVFAHLLLPHEPYIFYEDCAHREPYWPPTDYVEDQRAIRDAYTAQLQCLNAMLEELVAGILDASENAPIILLQADHGHGMMALNPMRGDQLPQQRLDPGQIDERTDIFAAYHLPHGGQWVIYDTITPINVLPAIFNYYFDADIPLNEDAVYWARLHPPFEITRIR